MKDITVHDLEIPDDHIDLIRDYSKMISYMENNNEDGIHTTVRLTLNNVGFVIHHKPSFLPWSQKRIHYFKIPRFVDVVENMQFLSIQTPKNWKFVIDNHLLEPGNPLHILNRYLSYVRIENISDDHLDNIEVLCTCIIYHPSTFPKLWEPFHRWYNNLPIDIMHSRIRMELFQTVDLYYFQAFCLGIRNIRILSKQCSNDNMIVRVATKERKELVHELIFHKFPFLNIFLSNENNRYPIQIEMTLIFL